MGDGFQIETQPQAPRFCPRCRIARTDKGPLCAECGETLQAQGYCPICEGFWKLAPGLECPKHDVELLDEAPPQLILSPEERTALVTVATFSHPNQASAPRIRLEAEGIPTFLDGERMAGTSYYQVATGGVRLQVPAALASAARILIHQNWAYHYQDEDLDDDWEELDTETESEPGNHLQPILQASTSLEAVVTLCFVGLIVVALITFLVRYFS